MNGLVQAMDLRVTQRQRQRLGTSFMVCGVVGAVKGIDRSVCTIA